MLNIGSENVTMACQGANALYIGDKFIAPVQGKTKEENEEKESENEENKE